MSQLGPAPTSADRTAPQPRGEHRVQLYDDEASLIDGLVGHLRPGLAEGVAVVIATPEHRDGPPPSWRPRGSTWRRRARAGAM